MSFVLFATWLDLEIIILTEISQTEKGKHMTWNLKKRDTQTYITEINSKKTTHCYKRGRAGIYEEFQSNRYNTTKMKYKKNMDLLYSTGNYIQYQVISYNGKESEKTHTHTHINEPLCYTPKAL